MNITVSHRGWLRGQATYADGWLTLENPDTYIVSPDPDLPFTLAGIRTPAEAVKFVSSFGLLRQGPETATLRERFTDWQQDALELVETMELYMAIRAAREGDSEAVARMYEVTAQATGQPKDGVEAKYIFNSAGAVLAYRLKEGTGVVEYRPEVVPFSDGRLVRTVLASTLLGVIYHQLTDLILEDREFRHCMDCGRVFLVGNPNQQFCNNTCASRHRYHRKAERQRRERQEASGATGGIDSDIGCC